MAEWDVGDAAVIKKSARSQKLDVALIDLNAVYEEETNALARCRWFSDQGSLRNASQSWATCEESEAKERVARMGKLPQESTEREQERHHDCKPKWWVRFAEDQDGDQPGYEECDAAVEPKGK